MRHSAGVDTDLEIGTVVDVAGPSRCSLDCTVKGMKILFLESPQGKGFLYLLYSRLETRIVAVQAGRIQFTCFP